MKSIPNHPRYPGIKPFDREDARQLFGRELDLAKLYDYLRIEQTIVLHGRSGMGKSSLVRAGLIPILERQSDTIFLLVRFGIYLEQSEQRLIDILHDCIGHKPNILLDGLDTQPDSEKTAWSKLKSLNTEKDHHFVLIFDQFEEVFSWPEKEIELLKIQLAELAFGKTPASYREKLRDMHFDGATQMESAEMEWLLQSLNVSLLFVVRSDRLSLLGSWSDNFPTILKNCFELKGLSKAQAVDALTLPAQLPGNFDSPNFSFSEAAVDKIMQQLVSVSGEIEPFQLQMIGEAIERQVVEANLAVVRPEDIPENILSQYFLDYYNSQFSELPEAMQQQARLLLEEELIHDSQRVRISLDALITIEGIDTDLIAKLEQTRLIRRDLFQNQLMIEISSDILLPPILQSRKQRMEAEEQEEVFWRERKMSMAIRRHLFLTRFLIFCVAVLIMVVIYLSIRG